MNELVVPYDIEEDFAQLFDTLDLDDMPSRMGVSKLVDQRHKAAKRFQRFLPIEIQVTPDALEKAREMREKNTPIILLYSHSTMRDPIDAIGAMVRLGKGFDDAIYSGPVAYHQWQKPHTRAFARMAHMEASPIITPNTIQKGKNFESVPFSEKILYAAKAVAGHMPSVQDFEEPQGKELGSRYGLDEYLDSSVETIKNSGIIFIAPQGQRLTQLGESPGPSLGTLIKRAKKYGIDMDEVGIWPMGIMIMDKNKPELHDENHRPLHTLRKTARIRLTAPTTVGILKESMKEMQKTSPETRIEDAAYPLLRRVLPKSYY